MKRPEKEQLQEVIASKTDDVDYRLILKSNGEFGLLRHDDENDAEYFDKINYVTRWETYDSGNGYVGEAASKDDFFIDSIMKWAIEAYEKHNKTGRMKIVNLYS